MVWLKLNLKLDCYCLILGLAPIKRDLNKLSKKVLCYMLCSRKKFPFREKMEKNSVLRRTLLKSYEFVLSYCTKAVLNRPSDAFYRLPICASTLEILFFLEHQFQLISVCFEQLISKIFVMKQPWSNILEKRFSILKTVKTLTHSKMTAANRLNHLLVHIYKKRI